MTSRAIQVATLLGLACSIGCVSKSTYFGPSLLREPPKIELGVQLGEDHRPGHLNIRLLLTSLSSVPETYCAGDISDYVATVDGTPQGYEFITSARREICKSAPLAIDSMGTVEWEDDVIFKWDASKVDDLRITVRVYPLDQKARANPKRFYKMDAYWEGGG